MAYRTGTPQSELADKFNEVEIAEILAFKENEFKTHDKSDAQNALLCYVIRTTLMAVNGAKQGQLNTIKLVDFLINYADGEKKDDPDKYKNMFESVIKMAKAAGQKPIIRDQLTGEIIDGYDNGNIKSGN